MKIDFGKLQDGQVFLAHMRFKNSSHGKNRPVVLMQNKQTGKWFIFKVTGKLDNSLNHKYGMQVNDWREAGFNKASIVKCNKEDISLLKPQNIIKKLGELTPKDLDLLYKKKIDVRKIETKIARRKQCSYER